MSVFGYFQRHEEKRRETNSGSGMIPPLLARVPAEKVRIIRKRFPNPRFLKRITAAVLGSVMLITSLCGFGGFASVFAAGGDGSTQGVTLRQADPSTMDTYLEMLDLLKDTRYAGRLWTDKSVFAKGQKISVKTAKGFFREFDGEELKLVKELDGLDGQNDGYITFNSDFLEVFSALSSGEVINENVPLDVMFLLDVSGSMGSVVASDGSAVAGTEQAFNDGDLPINILVKSLNAAIGQLLKASPESRIGITIYGSTAAVLLPLGHYTQNGNTPFLKEKWIGAYGTQGAHFSLTVEVKDKQNRVVTKYGDNAGLSNKEAHPGEEEYPGYQGSNAGYSGTGGKRTGNGETEGNAYHVGHITNPQAGLAAAMDQFITNNKEITFKGSNNTEYLRIPALMHITDGQATDIAWIQPEANEDGKDEWTHTVSNWNNVNLEYDLAYNSRRLNNSRYNTSQLSGVGDASPVIFQTLMTAAYYKSAVNAYYNSATVRGIDGKAADLQCYSVYASDSNPYGKIEKQEIQAPISAILDPLNEFKDVEGGLTDSSGLTSSTSYKQFIDTAYELYKIWLKGDVVGNEFRENTTSSDGNISIQLNASQDQTKQGVYENKPGFDNNGKLNITSKDVEDNINYVQEGHFQSSNFENLSGVISGIVQGLTGTLFAPVTGTNDLGVSDSLTFMDPMGKYMEVKNVTKLLLFGKLYDMVRAGVYNYQFVSTHRQNPGQEGTFQSGWYHMNSSGEWLGDVKHPNSLDAGLKDESCYKKSGGDWKTDSNGNYWEYYLASPEARKYVSTLPDEGDIDDLKANNPAQYRKFISTTYTFYRVNVNEDERGLLRMNPAYGHDTEALSEGQVGVYTLNDLRVWVEDTGSYSDDSVLHGGLHTDTGYDRALWINIPRYMLPLRTVTLTQDDNGGWTYKSNMEEGSSGYPASFPIRIFYEVGVSEDILTGDGHINTADVSAEYVKQNKSISEAWSKARGLNVGNDDGVGSLEFFSNWYNPENRYGDYVTSSVEYSYGDPAATFSPSSDNRYYIFQQALPLYRAAYRYDDGGGGVMWKRVGGKGSGETTPGGSGEGTNLAEFGGKIVAADLEISVDGDITDPNNESTVSGAITKALNSQNPAITLRSGEVVLLKDDRLTDVTHTEEGEDPFPSDAYYFVPIDYFELQAYDGGSAPAGAGDGTGTPVRYCVARKGSEFGSAYQSSGIKNGDMLCWYDASGANDEIYPYHSFDDTGDSSRGKDYIGLSPEEYTDPTSGKLTPLESLSENLKTKHNDALKSGDWTVAAKPGALRVGDLAQAVGSKVKNYCLAENYSGDSEVQGGGWAYTDSDPENGGYYKEARFPDKAEDDSFTIQYYNGNITRTANNYYLPTISLSAGEDGKSNDIVVDVYLGNNGRLTVADTALLLTKTVKPAEPGKPFNTDRVFSFDVTIQGRSGEYDAVVVKADDDGNWHRQLNYADVMTDSKLFLLNTDGTKALADKDGKRVILTGYDDESGEPEYAYEDGTSLPVDTEVYYVFIGSNTGGNALRVYQNPDGNAPKPDGFTEDSLKDILTVEDGSGGATYSAKSVWLFTQEQYASFAPNEEGNYADESGAPVSQTGDDPAGQSAFTKKLTTETTEGDESLFGGFPLLKLSPADSDDRSEVTDIMVESDYSTNSPYWAVTVNFVYATASVTLKHGYGLLFTGIPMKNQYTVTENLSDKDAADGYSFESLTHMQGEVHKQVDSKTASGQTSFFESAAHYVNTYITGSLGVKKEVVDDDKGGEFRFKVTLTVPRDDKLGYKFTKDLLTVEKTSAETSGTGTSTIGKTSIGTSGTGASIVGQTSVRTSDTVTSNIGTSAVGQLTDKHTVPGDAIPGKTIGEKSVGKSANGKTADKKYTLETVSESTQDEAFPPTWTEETGADGSHIYTAEFTLRHGEKVTVYGIPLGSSFTVAETERDGYNLQGVKKETETPDVFEGVYVNRADDSISGEIAQDGVDMSFIFRNGRAAVLPFTGGLIGAGTYIAAGLCLLAAAFAVTLITRRRGRHEK